MQALRLSIDGSLLLFPVSENGVVSKGDSD
jgi:hypothetical protein